LFCQAKNEVKHPFGGRVLISLEFILVLQRLQVPHGIDKYQFDALPAFSVYQQYDKQHFPDAD